MPPAASPFEALPEAFLERLSTIVPAGCYEAVVQTMVEPAAVGFRVNTLRAEPEAVLAALAAAGLAGHAVPWMAEARWLEARHRAALLATPAYERQHLYVQNLSSMVPPLVLDPQPGERVLDLTAAPGSKTLQMACLMQNTGELAAVESVKGRFYRLKANLSAQGATSVRTFLRDGGTVWRHRPEYFDRVLLDAPCSTEGRFRTDRPETYAYWSTRKVKEMAAKQRRLLSAAVQCLRPGGTLVYSTCAFAPEENEAVVARTLRRFDPALRLVPLGLDVPQMTPSLTHWQGRAFTPPPTAARRILPDGRMEAFFIARFEKTASTLRR